MSEEKLLLKKMSWKYKTVLSIIFVIGITVLSLTSLSSVILLKSILLYMVLTLASYLDYRFRIIPDWIHLVIIAIGFINFNVARSIFGLVISPLPFLIMALIHQGSIGGGDIKLVGATGFSIGLMSTLLASMLGLLLSLLFFYCFKFICCRENWNQSFPFAPFFQMGLSFFLINVYLI